MSNYKIKKGEGHSIPKSGSSFGDFMPLKNMEVGDYFEASLADIPRIKRKLESYGSKNGAAFFLNHECTKATIWRTA